MLGTTQQEMNKLRQQFQKQVRNSIMVFLNDRGVSVTDIAEIVGMDKSSVSRAIRNKVDTDAKTLMQMSKHFK